jgi:hypothetical protein
MEALGLRGFKSHYHASQALTVTELAEHQRKELAPAGKMLDITVPGILGNKAGLVIIQKFYQLGEYIFNLLILQSIYDCKITNSNRSAL